MSELDLTSVAASTNLVPAPGVSTVFSDSADKRAKQRDETGALNILVNDGLQDRNLLQNGGFAIRQRVAAVSTAIPLVATTTRAGQVCDRWAVSTGNATTTSWQQADSAAAPEPNLFARYYGKITQSGTAAKFILSQFIINADMAHVLGKKVRLSCKLKQFIGANAVYRLGLLQLAAAGTVDTPPATFCSTISAIDSVDPTWGTNLLPIVPDTLPVPENGTIYGPGVNVISTAGWLRYSCVFTVPSDARNLIPVIYRNSVGAVSDACGIAEVQLTIGEEIVDWVQTPIHEDLINCQRFFSKTFAQGIVPVTGAGINTGEAKGVAMLAGAVANAGIIAWRFPVTMWKTPTVTLFNPAAANALMRMIARVADMGATANTLNLDASTIVIATGVAATAVGDQVGIHITADSELK
jgi:hypothetical protein